MISEHLEKIPMNRPNLLWVSDLVPTWSSGEVYKATITFTLVKKEVSGMILNIVNFDPNNTISSYVKEEPAAMQVSPSPS